MHHCTPCTSLYFLYFTEDVDKVILLSIIPSSCFDYTIFDDIQLEACGGAEHHSGWHVSCIRKVLPTDWLHHKVRRSFGGWIVDILIVAKKLLKLNSC